MPSTQFPPRTGLALTSLVLGLLGCLTCVSVFGGIPAIVCGHLARQRARRAPAEYGGAGMALAGLCLGYGSFVVAALFAAGLGFYWLRARDIPGAGGAGGPSLNPLQNAVTASRQAESFVCTSHLKQIGLAFRLWADDNGDRFPFNVSTNQGGSLELCNRGPDGFEVNPAPHFQVLAMELTYPAILRCPGDRQTQPAASFGRLQSANVTFQLRTGPELQATATDEVLCRCPIHGLQLHADGSVTAGK